MNSQLHHRTLSDEARERLRTAFQATLEAGPVAPASVPGLGTFSREEIVETVLNTLVGELELIGNELPPEEFWWEFEEEGGDA